MGTTTKQETGGSDLDLVLTPAELLSGFLLFVIAYALFAMLYVDWRHFQLVHPDLHLTLYHRMLPFGILSLLPSLMICFATRIVSRRGYPVVWLSLFQPALLLSIATLKINFDILNAIVWSLAPAIVFICFRPRAKGSAVHKSTSTHDPLNMRHPPNTPPAFLFVILAIVVLAGVLRFANLQDRPCGLFRDEAEKGYNAWSLATTGGAVDLSGIPGQNLQIKWRRLPWMIDVMGGKTSAIYQYTSVAVHLARRPQGLHNPHGCRRRRHADRCPGRMAGLLRLGRLGGPRRGLVAGALPLAFGLQPLGRWRGSLSLYSSCWPSPGVLGLARERRWGAPLLGAALGWLFYSYSGAQPIVAAWGLCLLPLGLATFASPFLALLAWDSDVPHPRHPDPRRPTGAGRREPSGPHRDLERTGRIGASNRRPFHFKLFRPFRSPVSLPSWRQPPAPQRHRSRPIAAPRRPAPPGRPGGVFSAAAPAARGRCWPPFCARRSLPRSPARGSLTPCVHSPWWCRRFSGPGWGWSPSAMAFYAFTLRKGYPASRARLYLGALAVALPCLRAQRNPGAIGAPATTPPPCRWPLKMASGWLGKKLVRERRPGQRVFVNAWLLYAPYFQAFHLKPDPARPAGARIGHRRHSIL